MSFLLYAFFSLELFFVGYGDIREKKIPNMWSILNLLCFILFLFIFPDLYLFKIKTFVIPVTFLIVGYFLFLLRIMGGGDSKFLFSFFLVVPFIYHEKLFEYLLYSTVIIGLFTFLTNMGSQFNKILMYAKSQQYHKIKECFGTKFSYAPVILIAWLWLGFKNNFFL
jgi:prepilin peptidase CpaA